MIKIDRRNAIYQGDCITILENSAGFFKENKVDLIFADPPYNLSGNSLRWIGNQTGGDWYMVDEEWDKMDTDEYFIFTNRWISNCTSVLKEGGTIFISSTYHNLGEVIMSLKLNSLQVRNIITWYKTNAMPNMTRRVFTHACEYIVFATKGTNWTFNYQTLKDINPERTKKGKKKQMRDMWSLPLCQGKERIKNGNGRAAHPTQKPEELLKRIILGCTEEGDLVLDPFVGSGTTAYVAQKYGRDWLGIELDPSYIELAKKRLFTKENKEESIVND